MVVGFRASDYVVWISAYCPANGDKFRNVEAAFAELEFRYECLPPAEALSKLHLGDSGVLPSLHEQFDHSLVEIRSK